MVVAREIIVVGSRAECRKQAGGNNDDVVSHKIGVIVCHNILSSFHQPIA
jgi:hypothetical protein